ncbi:MAG: hypothetical protein ACLUNQ_08795 [Oscillospiraceae bacterium]
MTARFCPAYTVRLSGGAAADAAPERETPASAAARTEGCRIGIDLGGSDRKAAAVIDGETVYTEEVVWQPQDGIGPALSL